MAGKTCLCLWCWRNCSGTTHPCKALSHSTAKVRETLVNQETAGHTFTQAVLREAASGPTFLSPQIISHLYIRKRCATSLLGMQLPYWVESLLLGLRPGFSSAWLVFCLETLLPKWKIFFWSWEQESALSTTIMKWNSGDERQQA